MDSHLWRGMPQLLKPAAFVRPGGQKIRCIANAGVVKHRQLMYRDYLPLLHLRAIGAGFARRDDTRNNTGYNTRRKPNGG